MLRILTVLAASMHIQFSISANLPIDIIVNASCDRIGFGIRKYMKRSLFFLGFKRLGLFLPDRLCGWKCLSLYSLLLRDGFFGRRRILCHFSIFI